MNYNSTPSYKHWSKNYRQKSKKNKNEKENLNFRSRILKENGDENEFVGKVTKKYFKDEKKDKEGNVVKDEYTVHNISNIEECLDYRLIEGVNFSKDEITNQNCNLRRSERRGAVSNFEIIKAYERGIL